MNLTFNAHLHIADTAMGIAEYLGEPCRILTGDDAPQWVVDVVRNEKRAGWREFAIVELAPFINDAWVYSDLIASADFFDEFIPAFFDTTRDWPHFRAQSARDVGVAIGRQFELNQPIPFD